MPRRRRRPQSAEQPSGLPHGQRQEAREFIEQHPIQAVADPIEIASKVKPNNPPLSSPPQDNRPVQDGLSTGPGAGPETIQSPNRPQPTDQENFQHLIRYLPLLEHKASQPDASAALRSLVFRARAARSPEHTFTDDEELDRAELDFLDRGDIP